MSIASTLVGALLGILGTVLVQSLFASRNLDVVYLNDQIAQITSIEALAVDYWLTVGEDDADKEICKAARLRGGLDGTAQFLETAQRLFGASSDAYKEIDGEFFDHATGGTFEQAGRAADPERAIAVMQTANRMRSLLRAQRRRLYWAY